MGRCSPVGSCSLANGSPGPLVDRRASTGRGSRGTIGESSTGTDHPVVRQPPGRMPVMDQRLSVVTLGVRDLRRARAFYEALGWHSDAGAEDDVVFFQAPGM